MKINEMMKNLENEISADPKTLAVLATTNDDEFNHIAKSMLDGVEDHIERGKIIFFLTILNHVRKTNPGV